jgi:phosphatidylserine decarboxylase
MNYIIAREGWPFVGAALAFFVILVTIGYLPLTLAGFLVVIFVTWFFRNPERVIPSDDAAVISPADGRIIKIAKEGNISKISIFMSVFNVHVNRIPLSGTVKSVDYNKGRFLVASKDKASLENEQNAVTVVDEKGREIKFVQIAGLVARRIVCYIKEGDKVCRGERFGMIRFGSRLDVYLPDGMEILAKVGEKVKAGESILART